jgi:pyridoxal phosphate enzyme (YggS family)
MNTAVLIGNQLAEIERRLTAACGRVGRARDEVTLVGVSKTFPAEVVEIGIAAGLRVLGENRVQEAAEKAAQLAAVTARHGAVWHLIGHLQSNKVRRAVEIFSMIHSVDSDKLAERIDSICGETGRRMAVLLEVNLGGEDSKAGVPPAEALALCERIAGLPHLDLRGLMTVPPFLEDPEAVRPYFRRLRELRDEAQRRGVVGPGFTDLSMGMSHDFEVAIEEGATYVRIGTAIFGTRAVNG